ncbi:hypothetical protein Cme02nite_72530 [Catellatospora methionotrophica]|uniref:DUF4184 family protein n=1 Tax=Catellatospora methionotrophica TaxID=121620 RepID=A0A8J3LP86_9ACTN|nr:DUF4184 family protein [Catellatospora methionotrophica]GIG18921.1 hypothetical protein Cme02nite_72530 [Catellatospora methionotrophica]
MPLTFPAHPAAVLPLKLWRPRWFDGVALTAGAVVPDVAYLALDADGRPFADTHTWHALLWWSLPVALAYTWVVRRTVGTVAAHLPGSRWFTWRAYAELAHHRRRWPITAASCLLGAASHVAWDHLTHTDGWIGTVFGVRWADVSAIPWWTVSDLASTIVGTAVTVGIAFRAGRHSTSERVVAADSPRSPQVRPRLFWAATVTSGLAGLLAVPSLPGAEFPAATGVRLLHVAAVALLTGAVAVRISAARERSPAGTPP